MDKQIQQLLKEKDYQGALEVLKPRDENAGLVLADYLNEKKMWEQQYTSDEVWQAYTGEVLMRVKQLCQEDEERQAKEMVEGNKPNEVKFDTQAMPKVFISYSNKDSKIVKKVTDYLEEHHYDYFVDVITLMPGEVIEEKVTKEIIERDYFVILLSRNSLQSPWVCLETVVSKAKETCGYGFTVPVRVDDCLDDMNFLLDVREQINACIADMDKHIERSKKYSSDHKFIDIERQRHVDFQNNYSSMIERYRKMAGINISGDLFEDGMKKLMGVIQKSR